MSKDQGQNNKITLTVVVSGEGTSVDTNLNATLTSVAEKALEQVGSKEKDLSKWKLTNSSKQQLGFNQKVGEAGLKDGDTIYLDLKAGVTG